MSSPEQIAAQIFSQAPGALGRIHMIPEKADNEFIAQIFANMLLVGLTLNSYDVTNLSEEQIRNLNHRMQYTGFVLKYSKVPRKDYKHVHYAKFPNVGSVVFRLNKHHPFALMEEMERRGQEIPDSYENIFLDRTQLSKIHLIQEDDMIIVMYGLD